MKKHLVFILALVTLFSLCVTTEATAQPGLAPLNDNTASCYPLDVIFVIDQSGSMSDRSYATDPTNQRQTAVQAMVDWLGENVLDVCPTVRHQVGVISFGTRARIDLPLSQIAPTTTQELLALNRQIDQYIVADDLFGTEPLEAFKQIPRMFADSKITSNDPRKRVVVLLTDGLIGSDSFATKVPEGYIGKTQILTDFINDALPFDPILLKREQCLSFLVSAYGHLENVPYDKQRKCLTENDATEEAYSESTYLYIVLMNYGQAWPPAVKRLYQDVTASHAGAVMDFYNTGQENRQEIPSYFQTVLSTLTGVPTGQVQCGGVAVNPYLQKAVFTFYKFSPDTKVSLRYTDAGGTLHQMIAGESPNGGFDIEDYQAYGSNERYIFKKPYPGIWYIESDRCQNGGINAFYQQVQVNPGGFTLSLPELPKHDLAPYYDVSSPIYLTYQMHDDAGEIIEDSDQPYFDINVQATVKDSTGEALPYTFKWMPEQHLFQANEPLKVPEAGVYHVSFVGTAKFHNGELSTNSEVLSKIFDADKVVFQNEDLEFRVKDLKPFVINILKPADKQVLPQIHGSILMGWPLPIVPVPVKVELTGRNGPLEIPVPEIISNPESAFTAWITAADGNSSETISLKPDPSTPGQFIGEIPWNDSQAEQELHVKLVGGYSSDYAPDAQEVQSTFSRQDLNPFYRAGFYKLLLIVFVLAILAWIFYEIWLHLDLIRGTIVIQKNNVVLDRWDAFSGLRISTYKVKDKDEKESKHLRELKIRYAPKAKPGDEDTTNIITRKVIVSGMADCGRKFGFSMEPGDTVPFCEDHPEWTFHYK